MNYIPTPETDEAELKSIAEYNNPDGADVVFVCDGYDLARKLERERSEALADLAFRRELYALQTAQLDDMQKDRDEWKAKYIQQNKDLGCELMDPNGTIWEYAQRLQRERGMAREGWADEIRKGQAELRNAEQLYNEAIRERDEAREAEASEAKWAALYKAERDTERALADRLAEALEWYRLNVGDCNKITAEGDLSRDALAKDYGRQASSALTAWKEARK